MLIDPITVAASAPNPELKFAMIKHDNYGSERLDTNGGGYTLTINHERSRSTTRHYLRVAKTVDATNPYSGVVQPKTAAVSISISRPEFGFDDNAMVALVKALTETLADSEVTPAKLLQFQS
jgi:siderophore synthetase component